MKKMGKVARLAALLVLTLLFGLFPIESGNNLNKVQAATTLNNPRTVADSSMNAKQKVTWDCVWFGAYPQSEVTSGDIYNKLKNATGWDENNDIVIDGNKYRRLKGEDATYHNTSSSMFDYNWNNDYSSYHYFKYEPVKWRVLGKVDDVFDGENYAGTGTLRDDITDGILSSTKCAPYGDDEIYLAPFNSGPQGLIYNKTFFDENNLEVPKTWDEFFALGDKVKDIDGRALFTYQGIYPGYMEEMLWPAIANECGEEALTKIANYEEGSFNNEGVLKALSHIKEIADKGYLLEGTVGMNHTESQTEMMLGKAAFITNGTWMENEMQDAPREDGFEFAMAPIPTENADDVHYVFDSCEQFSIPAAAKNPELAKEFLRFLYSDESVSAFAEASGALYATKSAREVAKDKLSTAIYNMYGIYEEANASSLIMSFAAVPADCKVNPKDEIFNPITSVMNDEMTVEEWAQNVEDAFAQVRADMEAAN